MITQLFKQEEFEARENGINISTRQSTINFELCHEDINKTSYVTHYGDFVVTENEGRFHVWDISEATSDQWQHFFEKRDNAEDYAQTRNNGGSFCLLSKEGHTLE